jgi:hypothetical protein
MKYLGKKPPVHNPKALRFGKYLLPGVLPHIPEELNWGAQVPSWPMYGNDTIGDCTIAAAGHMEGLWSSKESGKEDLLPESDIITAYSAVSGYIPGDENTDNGADLNSVMQYWTKTGIGGNKIYSSVVCAPRNTLHVKASAYLFGGCYIGLALPATLNPAAAQPGDCWSVESNWESDPNAQPGSLGGHCVDIVGYNDKTLAFITWGMELFMTWDYWRIYCDEAYGLLSPQWAPGGSVEAPDKFDLAQLQADAGLVIN